MEHAEYCYVDFGFRSVDHRAIIRLEQAEEAVAKADHFNCFQTWYRFPQTVKHAGTVKGYRGPCMADALPFDFDDADDLGRALIEARKFVGALEVDFDVRPDDLRYFFSGRKGFHVLMPAELFGGFQPSASLPDILRSVANDLAGNITVDEKIYDRQRFLRVENTKHADSGLFRIPLESSVFLHSDVEAIREMAQEPCDIEQGDGLIAVPGLIEVYRKHRAGTREKDDKKKSVGVSELFKGGLGEGDGRDQRAFDLACHLRNQKVPPTTALNVLRVWDSTNDPSLADTDGVDVLQRKIANAYGETDGDDGVLTLDSIKNVEELAEEYTAYIENLKTRRVFLGYPRLDGAMRGIAPGEMMFLIAKASVGKSAFVQNIQRKLCEKGQWSLFVSLEQPLPQCFERMGQMTVGQSGAVIEDLWQDVEQRMSLLGEVQRKMSRALVVGQGMGVADIPVAMQLAEQKIGERVSCVLIDYLGYLDMYGFGSRLYEQVSGVSRELKKVAKQMDRAVICVTQVSREAGGNGSEPLGLGAARDSGVIEESGDFVLGLYREKEQLDNDQIALVVQLLKNRKGWEGEVPVTMSRKSLRIEEIDTYHQET